MAVSSNNSSEVEYEAPLWHAVLELTNACNLRCPYCASRSGVRREVELTQQEWFELLEQLVELGAEGVTLMGGELFLYEGWLNVARRAREVGLGVGVITNGLLVDSRRLADLISLDLDILGVSLDGATREGYRAVRGVDGFDHAWRLIREVHDAGAIEVNGITTLCQLNLDQVDPLVELFEGRGINWQVQFASAGTAHFDRSLVVTPRQYGDICLKLGELMIEAGLSNWITTTDDFGYFPIDSRHHLLHAHWRGCQAGIAVLGIRSNGDLIGCASLGDAFVESNLREGPSLVERWRSPETFAALRRKSGDELVGGCGSCAMARVCRGGCTAMAVSSTGAMHENLLCLRRLESDCIVEELLEVNDGMRSTVGRGGS